MELGCASGGNLIPHAARYPDATFVGVDLARTQVAAGRARIERLAACDWTQARDVSEEVAATRQRASGLLPHQG